jgi:prevent-host-death family protein
MSIKSNNRWQMQDAKARLSHVVKAARSKGPQIITIHGEEVAVIQSIDDFKRKAGKERPSMLEALLQCPPGPPLKIHRDTKDRVGNSPRIFD